jgi:hypothetical protein
LNVRALDRARTVGSPNPFFDAQITGVVNNETPQIAGLTVAFSTTATGNSPAGTYQIIPSGPASLPNYEVTYVPGTLTVSDRQVPQVIWSVPAPITYGQPLGPQQLNATVEGVPGTFVYTPAPGTVMQAGTAQSLSVTFNPADPTQFAPATRTVAVDVLKRGLTVKANDKSRSVGAQNPVLDSVFTGLVNGDSPATIGLQVNYSTTANLDSGVGNYPITAAGPSSLQNYEVSYVPGTLSVTSKIVPSITWANPAEIQYGTPLTPTQLNATASIGNGAPVAGTFVYTPLPGTLLRAGALQTLSVTFTPADSATYEPATRAVQINIRKKPLTVRANNQIRPYGTLQPPPFTAAYDGFVPGDDPSKLGGSLVFAVGGAVNGPVGPATPVGKYPITPGGQSSPDYEIMAVNGELEVTRLPITVKAKNVSRSFGQPNPMLQTYDALEFFPGFANNERPETVGLVFSAAPGVQGLNVATSATAESPAGSYPITVTGPAQITNYTIAYQSGTLNVVSKAQPVITWMPAPDTLTYGTALSGAQLNASASASQGGAAVPGEFVYTPAAGTVLPAGVQSVTVTFNPADTDQYSPVTRSFPITVQKKSVTVTARSYTRVYGAPNPVLEADFVGLANGETAVGLGLRPNLVVNQQNGLVAGSVLPAGSYLIQPTGVQHPNYDFVPVSGTLTVEKAQLTVTANNKTRAFGAANPVFDATYTGLVLGETPASTGLVLTFTCAAGQVTPAGSTVDILVSSTTTSANYAPTFVKGALTVSGKKVPSITWNPPTQITYGAALASNTYETAVARDGNTTVPGTFAYDPSPNTVLNAGNGQTLRATFTPTNSSVFETVSRVVSINVLAKPLTITAKNPASRPYAMPVPEIQAAIDLVTVVGLNTGDSLAGTNFTGTLQVTSPGNVFNNGLYTSPAGTYPVFAGGLTSTNYAITYVQGSLEVTRAPLVVTAENKSRAFGAPNPVFTASAAELRNGDTVERIGLQFMFSTPAVQTSPKGNYTIAVSGPAMTANYAVTYRTGTLTVTEGATEPAVTWTNPAPITYGTPLTAAQLNATAVFGTTGVPGTFVYTPALGTVLPASTESGNQRVPRTLSVTFRPTDTTRFMEVTRTVQIEVLRKPLTVTAANSTKAYGVDGPAAPFSVAQYAGFVNGDDAGDLVGAAAFACRQPNGQDVGAATPVGTYPIVPSGLSSPNYDITFAPGFLNVTKRDLNLFAVDVAKVYGEVNPVFQVAAVSGDLVNGDTLSTAVSGVPRFTTQAVTTSPVGSYAVTPDGLVSLNYNVKYDGRGRLTVNRRTLTVKANDKTRRATDPNPVFDASFDGLIAPDTVASLRLALTFSTTPGATSDSFNIVPAGAATVGNYAVTYQPGLLTMVAADKTVPTVTWANPADITYGTALGSPQLNAVLKNGAATLGVADGTITYSPAANTVLEAGNGQQLTVTFAPNPGSSLAPVSRSVPINVRKRPLTVGVAAATRFVGQANPSFTPTSTSSATAGLVNGDQLQSTAGLTISYACVAGPNSPAGNYDVVPSGATSPNYEVTYLKGTLTVSEKPGASFTWNAPADITYGTALSNTQLNASGPSVPGSFQYDPPTGTVLRGGVQTLKATFTPDDTAQNAVVVRTVKINVLRKPITLTADNKTRNFGEANPVFTATYGSGFVDGDGPGSLPAPALSCQASETTPGGTYPIRIAPVNSPDYAVSVVEGALTVADTGAISFTKSTFSVVKEPNGDVTETITVRRSRGKLGGVSAVVTVTPGTAAEGADGDYTVPAAPITLIWGDNEDGDKQFLITLKSTAQLSAAGDTVLLSLAAGAGSSVSLGEQTTATVILAESNSNKPAVSLSAPTSNAKLVAENVVFRGQVTGVGIARVEVVLNGGESRDADLVPVAGSTTKFDWSLSAIPEQGTNTVVVTAYDIQGDPSTPLTRSFSFSYVRPLLAATYDGLLVPTVDATVPADQHGMVTVTVDRAGALSGRVFLGGVSVPFKGNLLADLAAGVLFGNPPAHKGPEDSGYQAYVDALENLKKLKITRTVNRQLQTIGILTLRLDDSGEYPVVTGQLLSEDNLATEEDETVVLSAVIAKKAVYSAAKVLPEGMLRVPTEILDAASEKGNYTALFATDEKSTDLDTASYPHGAGSARLTVSTAGVVTIIGRLSDGTAISLSSRLSPDNDLPLYSSLYSAKGFVSGSMKFDESAMDSDAVCESMVWFRPNTRTTTTKNLTALYPDGWPEGIAMQVFASKYIAPAKATVRAPNPPNPNTVLGAAVVGVTAPAANLQITLVDGMLPDETLNTGALSALSAVTVYPAPEGTIGASQMKITFVPASGLFSGSFLHPVSKKTVTFSGAAFQKTGQALGSFLYMPVVATDPEGTPQVGSVVLSSGSGQ